MKYVKCIENNFTGEFDPEFTVGKSYEFYPSRSSVVGDDNCRWYLDDNFCYAGSPHAAKFELVEDTQNESDETQCAYVSTEAEEELFETIEEKQKQSVDCPVAIAYHIHELQKWLKHIGCDSEAEFRISSEYVWASPDEFVIYEAKEGGVGTLIEYMRHIGGANKCLEKMEEL